MSTEEKSERLARPLTAYLVGGGALLLLVLGIVIIYWAIQPPPARNTASNVSRPEDPLEVARKQLAYAVDPNTCKTVVQQLNDYLNRSPESRPSSLTPDQRAFLEKQFIRDHAELAEIEAGSFTPLDAHHLDLSLLVRDVARVIQDAEEKVPPAPPADQAAAAFAWTMRQVRLVDHSGELLPPQLILRLGQGNALERSIVFLELLRQLGLPGCLVLCPSDTAPLRLWACGVLIARDGADQVLLFDPRLGLPLPGPDGKGIATLAELRARPELLGALTTDEKHPYDVKPEQIKQAQVHLVCPLSALAPRMVYLEGQLKSPAVRAPAVPVSLGTDAQALYGRFKAAVGPQTELRFAAPLGRLLLDFLPVSEGGTDRSNPDRMSRFRTSLVPWQLLPAQLQQLKGEPGQRLRGLYARAFVELVLDPMKPRDLVLRGQFDEAASELTRSLEEAQQHKSAATALPPDWNKQLTQWCGHVTTAQAKLIDAQDAAGKDGATPAVEEARRNLDLVWKSGVNIGYPVVQAAGADLRTAQLTYLLALGQHEQAEQRQARLDRLRRAGTEAEEIKEASKEASSAWADAARWWGVIADQHATATEAAAARRMHARVLTMQGNSEAAASRLEDLSGDLTPLEKTAHLYLARLLRGAKAGDRK